MIYFFNPGHEHAVLNASPYYMAPTNVLRMTRELQFLPAWYASKDSYIFVNQSFDFTFYKDLKSVFVNLPLPVTIDDIKDLPTQEIIPWGISPQSIHYFSKINIQYSCSHMLPQWESNYSYINSRLFALECLHELKLFFTEFEHLKLPILVKSVSAVEDILNNSNQKYLIKAPYSSSGRGLLWLPKTLTRTEKQILTGILKKQQQALLERVLDKKVDFAMEFISDGEGNVIFIGYSLFTTNKKGSYQGNILKNQQKIVKYLTTYISPELLISTQQFLSNFFATRLGKYKGCLGVDMMIYEDNNKYFLNPCIEINLRYNMGYLSIQLFDKYINKDREGYFIIDYFKDSQELIYSHHLLKSKYPLQIEKGRIQSGYLNLCPLQNNAQYRAYVLIS